MSRAPRFAPATVVSSIETSQNAFFIHFLPFGHIATAVHEAATGAASRVFGCGSASTSVCASCVCLCLPLSLSVCLSQAFLERRGGVYKAYSPKKWPRAYSRKSPSAYFEKSPSAYFEKSPTTYFGKTSCHTIEITASRARPRLRLGPPSTDNYIER